MVARLKLKEIDGRAQDSLWCPTTLNRGVGPDVAREVPILWGLPPVGIPVVPPSRGDSQIRSEPIISVVGDMIGPLLDRRGSLAQGVEPAA